jgi:hypothetical protein
MRFLEDLLIAMEDRQILGSAEMATNFTKLSCPAASQESPGMFYISVFHSDRFLQEVLLLIIEDMECRGLDIIYYIKFSWILDEFDHHHHHHGDCLWNNCSLQRKTDLSWTCSINCKTTGRW